MTKDRQFGPMFLSVGAMKAGTTWLYSVLRNHPELFFSTEKEIHYFHAKYVDRSVLSEQRRLENAQDRYLQFDPQRSFIGKVRNDLHWVANYLSNPVDDFWYRNLFAQQRNQTYACDFSNLYALLPTEAWRQIEADCSRLRVIYTLRDPIKRLWSHVKFHLQVTGQTDRLAEWGAEEFDAFARQPFIWKNAEYGACLRAMRQGLPEPAFRCVFFEDMHADQPAMLSGIEDFLAIGHHAFPQDMLAAKVNTSIAHPMPDFFADLFAPDMRRITQEVVDQGLALPESWSPC